MKTKNKVNPPIHHVNPNNSVKIITFRKKGIMKTKKIDWLIYINRIVREENKKLIQAINELDNHITDINREEALLWGRIVILEKELEKHKGKDSGHCKEQTD